jgi:hypothetical protein
MHKKEIEDLEKFADWMDSKFQIPGTQINFGLDSLFGLIPGVGDTITMASTGYLLRKAQEYNMPKLTMAHMVWNMFIDWLIGLIPLLGDIFDIGWKSNKKNVALIKKHLENSSTI